MSTIPVKKEYVLSYEATEKLFSALGFNPADVTFMSFRPTIYGNILTIEAMDEYDRSLRDELPDLSKELKPVE